jgi:hypothetical protein
MVKFLKFTLTLTTLFLLAGQAESAQIGVGAFWGKNLPIVQEDASLDKLYGFKLILIPLSFVALEPNFTYSGMGQATLDIGGTSMTRDGGQIKSYGVDLLLGNFSSRLFHFYLLGGLNSSTLQKEALPDSKRTSFSAGLGLEITPIAKLGLEVQGKALLIPLEGGGAKDNLGIAGGINIYIR